MSNYKLSFASISILYMLILILRFRFDKILKSNYICKGEDRIKIYKAKHLGLLPQEERSNLDRYTNGQSSQTDGAENEDEMADEMADAIPGADPIPSSDVMTDEMADAIPSPDEEEEDEEDEENEENEEDEEEVNEEDDIYEATRIESSDVINFSLVILNIIIVIMSITLDKIIKNLNVRAIIVLFFWIIALIVIINQDVELDKLFRANLDKTWDDKCRSFVENGGYIFEINETDEVCKGKPLESLNIFSWIISFVIISFVILLIAFFSNRKVNISRNLSMMRGMGIN